MAVSIAGQVKIALAEADVVVAVLDATQEPLPADREAVKLLRQSDKPVIWVATKADSKAQQRSAMTHYEMGIPDLMMVSGLHGHGLGELDEAIVAAMPARVDEGAGLAPGDVPRVAIVGRPNAGKSSLVNELLGEARQLVDDRPGTTVDSIDALLNRDGDPLVLIDTAGIRRKRSVKGAGVEGLAVMNAIRAMERSDVVVLMIDATTGAAEQDAKIAGLADQRGRALVIALNKIDTLDRDGIDKELKKTREVLAFASWAPIVTMSVKNGRGVQKLMATVRSAVQEHRKRVGTADTNRFFEEVLERHPPPSMRNKPVRLYYVTQAQIEPPTFVAITNEPTAVHFSYQRYVINQIRKQFGFEGTPVRVLYRKKKRR
jgi:GTPase